jgi:hypothetical protein
MRSGANFDSACNDEGRPSEPLGNSVDSKQHKDVGLVVEFFSGCKACRRFGLRALPIDKDTQESRKLCGGKLRLVRSAAICNPCGSFDG